MICKQPALISVSLKEPQKELYKGINLIYFDEDKGRVFIPKNPETVYLHALKATCEWVELKQKSSTVQLQDAKIDFEHIVSNILQYDNEDLVEELGGKRYYGSFIVTIDLDDQQPDSWNKIQKMFANSTTKETVVEAVWKIHAEISKIKA